MPHRLVFALCLLGFLSQAEPAWSAGANEASSASSEPAQIQLSLQEHSPAARLIVTGQLLNAPDQSWVHRLQISSNLVEWSETALLNEAPFSYTDPRWNQSAPRYYRSLSELRSSEHDWANQIRFGSDAFWRRPGCDSRDSVQWAKFLIKLDEPHRVYFQDNHSYPLHYDFATARIPGFIGLSSAAFNALSLRREGQQVVLGTLLAPIGGSEMGIQFTGMDPYTPEQVLGWIDLVRECVTGIDGAPVFYVPTYEQSAVAWAAETSFAKGGIPLTSSARWLEGTTACYSPGWAVARLNWVPAAEIAAAYSSGRLLPSDILLTDSVPSELPYVSGIVCLHPATPNSHVALLAASYEIPFVYLAEPERAAAALALAGQTVLLRTGSFLGSCDIGLEGLDTPLTPLQAKRIVESRPQSSFQIVPKRALGELTSETLDLTPDDTGVVGGKAANFGLLRRVIPENSPEAIAFSFDLWDGFLAQVLPDGRTLRQQISSRLSRFTYPPNVTAVEMELRQIRDLFTKSARFSDSQSQKILSALSRFGTQRKIRFRSSTNVEDSESFSGAGLYDSFSGCLGDDLDPDSTGPSVCDAEDLEERGVFRAIQKVFASFYNNNAFLERLRLGVTEAEAGMALLVHYSTPDEQELANGVATVRALRNGTSWLFYTTLVSQSGAVSVSNPDPAVRAEEATYSAGRFGTNLSQRAASSLVPQGTQVMAWPVDYLQLGELIQKVAQAYTDGTTNRSEIQLDLEYKKTTPGWLQIKQIREIPMALPSKRTPTFLVAEAREWVPFGSILATHRLKSRWQLTSTNIVPVVGVKPESLYTRVQVDYNENGQIRRRNGYFSSWPSIQVNQQTNQAANTTTITHSWTADSVSSVPNWSLITRLITSVDNTGSPPQTLADGLITFNGRYARPLPSISFVGSSVGSLGSVTEESVTLYPASPTNNLNAIPLILTTNGLRWTTQQRHQRLYGAMTSYTARPDCITVGGKASYAYSGVGGSSRIVGLIPEALELGGDFSQTVLIHGREGHEHVQEAVVDPWMEQDLPLSVKSSLILANIRLVIFQSYQFGDYSESIWVIGLDDTIRRWTP